MNSIDAGYLQEGLSPFPRGGASPFIDKGDGLTSERVRVCMLLGSVTHAGGYKIMAGAYNTVDCHCRMSDAHGRSRCLLLKMADVDTCKYC